MAALRRLALPPAAAAEALRKGRPEVARIWDALVSGDVDAVLVGSPPEAPAAEAPTTDASSARAAAATETTATEAPGSGAPATGTPAAPSEPWRLLPGSFNPVHEGHRRMLALAAARLGAGGAYELAILNPDKPALSPGETARRLAGFSDAEAVWLTRAPTFPEKARIFPGATFVVGVDTIVRIAEPRYYGGPDGLAAALSLLGRCRFLVFGRRTAAGFETLESVTLPAPLRALCDGVPEADFRADVSSTELRRAGVAAGMNRRPGDE